MFPIRSHIQQNDNVPFRDLMAAIVDRQDVNAKYLQKLAEERKKGNAHNKGNAQSPPDRVNRPMVLDSQAKTQVVKENQGLPKLAEDTKHKKKESHGMKNRGLQEKSPYDKMEAVRSYARRREQIQTGVQNETSDQSNQKQTGKPPDLCDAASVDSGCSSEKSADVDMQRVEQILQSVHLGKTRAAGYPSDPRASRRLHYVVAHGPAKAPPKKPKRDNMNRFYTPSLDTKAKGNPQARTKSVPSTWQPHGEPKTHPKFRTASDGTCKYYCRNYPDYLREMQMERLVRKQRLEQAAEDNLILEQDGMIGHDLRELVKPSSPNKYNSQYSFSCVNVMKPARLPKLMDNASAAPEAQNGGMNVSERRNTRKKDQNMSSKDIVNLRTKIRNTCENSSRLAGHGSTEHATEVPMRVPCPPQTTGMQKYFDRGTNATRIRRGCGAGLTYTGNPRATGYANGGVITYRGGKETVYMLKELGDPGEMQTPENTAVGSQIDNEGVNGPVMSRGLGGTFEESPSSLPPVNVPRTEDVSEPDTQSEVVDKSRWVGRIYQKVVEVPQQDVGAPVTIINGRDGEQSQAPKTNGVFFSDGNIENNSSNRSETVVVAEDCRPIVTTDPVEQAVAIDTTVVVVDQEASTSASDDTPQGEDEAQSKGLSSLLSVPMVHAERIRTLEEGCEGKDGDLSIPEIRMIAATPLPPDFEF